MKLYRCWCRAEWDVQKGRVCPSCGRTTDFPAFTRTHVASGIHDDADDGGGTVRMIDLQKIQPGTYDDLYVGPMAGPEWEAWCEKNGL